MTDVSRALYAFFSGFGLPAYPEQSVPKEYPDEHGVMQPVTPPYITYEIVQPDRLRQAPIHARIWYRSTTLVPVTVMAEVIRKEIDNGHTIPTETGAIRLWPDETFAQIQPADEPDLKIAYLSMIIEADYD